MGVPIDIDDEYTQTVLFSTQREQSTCFYKFSPPNEKDESRHNSAELDSTSFYQNSARPSSESF